jgi:hypothetical protein
MMMKIQRATPASFRLIDLAKAGVAIKMSKLVVSPLTNDFFPFNIPHSPFLFGFNLKSAFHVPTLKQKIVLIKLCEIINFYRYSSLGE